MTKDAYKIVHDLASETYEEVRDGDEAAAIKVANVFEDVAHELMGLARRMKRDPASASGELWDMID